MKAMIFAAGLGSRLRPLTDTRPKALVEVGGVPMLERVIKRLVKSGFDDITVNVHHFAPMIIDFIDRNDGFGASISISDESDMLLDTGGGIVKASPLLEGDSPVLVHNVDIFTDLDYCAMMNHHLRSGAMATLLVASRETSRYLLMERHDLRMRGWTNVTTGAVLPAGLHADDYAMMAFGGIHIIDPSLFKTMKAYGAGRAFSITPFYVAACRNFMIKGYEPEADYTWVDIGRPESLELAERLCSR